MLRSLPGHDGDEAAGCDTGPIGGYRQLVYLIPPAAAYLTLNQDPKATISLHIASDCLVSELILCPSALVE